LVSQRIEVGELGRMKTKRIARPTVRTPSTMKSQRQPSMPWTPSSLRMPIAKRPPKALPSWEPE
jgi:hypothetical protein